MRRVEQVRSSIVEHGAPACRWRRNAESEKTHGGFGQNRASHPDRGLHNYGLNNVGKNVAHDDAQIGRAESAGGFDKFTFARGQNLSTNQARITNPSTERKRKNEIEDAGAAEGDECN